MNLLRPCFRTENHTPEPFHHKIMHYPVRYMNQAFSRSFSLSHKASRPCFSFGCIILFLWVIGVGWTAPAPNPNNDTYPPTVSLDELAKEIDKALAGYMPILQVTAEIGPE